MNVEQIKAALAEHEHGGLISSRDRWTECMCGERVPWLGHEDAIEHYDSHRAHVAEVIAALLPEATERVEWGVMVPALGDTEPEVCPSEENARYRQINPHLKWTHGNPVTLHRRTVTEWTEVQP